MGLVTLTENVHERICTGCAQAWECHRDRGLFEVLVAYDAEAGALQVWRNFQDEQRLGRAA
jgi:hypothetical protein